MNTPPPARAHSRSARLLAGPALVTSGLPMTAAGPAPDRLGTILSVWAHPDDETYLAGGLMAAARDHGRRVVCASATAGEHGTEDPGRWPPARLGPVRRWEAAAALAVLGVTEHEILGLPDGALAHHDESGLAWAGRLLDDVRPDTVLTFGPDGMTGHPDHVAVHRWVSQAWDERGRQPRLLYAALTTERLDRFLGEFEEWGMFMSDERPRGLPPARLAVRLLLDGPRLDRKVTALRAMATQTGALLARLGPDGYAAQVAEEAFVEAADVAVPPRLAGRRFGPAGPPAPRQEQQP